MSTDKLPDGWTRVKFGDVVHNVNENSRDLAADGLDRVVGLDHLDPGSLRLMRWDNLADLPDGTTFTRKFKPGQVLFGKRRAYQRKVAVPDFAGVCSGDILVFEPADKRMLAEFLPYLVQSDGFFDHALGTSAGSLSPRTKWVELAKYEFALPPLDEQQRIVDVIGAVDQMVDARLLVRAKLEPLKRSVFSASLRGDEGEKSLAWGAVSSSVTVQCLGNLCTVIRGASPRPKGNPAYFARGSTAHHWIMISDVTRSKVGKVLTDTAEFLTDEGVTKSRKVSPGSLLLTNCATVGVPVFSGVHGCIHDGFLLFEDLSPELNVDYLYRLFEFLTPWFRSSAQTGTQANLNTEILRRLEVPMLPLSVQAEVVSRLDRIDEMSVSVDDSLDDLKRVRSALLDSLLVRGSHVQ
jgi:type I restriction enzyme S subunit